MIDSYLRHHYQKALADPLSQTLSRKKLPPHLYTLGALLSGVLVLPALYFQLRWPALFLLALSGLLDTVDGTVARIKNQTSPKGAVLDIVSDRLVELSVIVGLYCESPLERGFLSILMLGSAFICVTSFLVVGIFTANESEKGFHYSPGIMERGEAFLFFAALILFPPFFTPLASLFIVLVFLTALLRIIQFLKSPSF